MPRPEPQDQSLIHCRSLWSALSTERAFRLKGTGFGCGQYRAKFSKGRFTQVGGRAHELKNKMLYKGIHFFDIFLKMALQKYTAKLSRHFGLNHRVMPILDLDEAGARPQGACSCRSNARFLPPVQRVKSHLHATNKHNVGLRQRAYPYESMKALIVQRPDPASERSKRYEPKARKKWTFRVHS